MDPAIQQLMDEFDREHRELLAQIISANMDIEQWVHDQPVSAVYDPEDDSLRITIGESRPALSESIENQVLLRVDPQSLRLVGFEILSVRLWLKEHPEHFATFARIMAAGKESHFKVESSAVNATGLSQLQRELRGLVYA